MSRFHGRQADLRNRTGLSIERIQIGRYDLLRDAAEIMIYYRRRTPDA